MVVGQTQPSSRLRSGVSYWIPGSWTNNVFVTADDGRVDHENRACFLLVPVPPTSFIVSGKSWPLGGVNNRGKLWVGIVGVSKG